MVEQASSHQKHTHTQFGKSLLIQVLVITTPPPSSSPSPWPADHNFLFYPFFRLLSLASKFEPLSSSSSWWCPYAGHIWRRNHDKRRMKERLNYETLEGEERDRVVICFVIKSYPWWGNKAWGCEMSSNKVICWNCAAHDYYWPWWVMMAREVKRGERGPMAVMEEEEEDQVGSWWWDFWSRVTYL